MLRAQDIFQPMLEHPDHLDIATAVCGSCGGTRHACACVCMRARVKGQCMPVCPCSMLRICASMSKAEEPPRTSRSLGADRLNGLSGGECLHRICSESVNSTHA